MNRAKVTLLVLLLTLGIFVQTTTAQYPPTDARVTNSARVPLLRFSADEATVPLVEKVGAIGMTVSDMDGSVDFYSRVLSFEKVSDVEASLKFYRDLLGLQIAGTSQNYGTEQEHLNNVFGARLRITSLRAGSGGPGIEFLEYLAPRDGRPVPGDARASDLFHWQTSLIVNTADTFAKRLLAENSRFVSPGVVSLNDKSLGFSKACWPGIQMAM